MTNQTKQNKTKQNERKQTNKQTNMQYTKQNKQGETDNKTTHLAGSLPKKLKKNMFIIFVFERVLVT